MSQYCNINSTINNNGNKKRITHADFANANKNAVLTCSRNKFGLALPTI